MGDAFVLRGGRVVTSLDPVRIVEADVAISGGRIAELSKRSGRVSSGWDCSGCLILPGHVVAHHHLYSSLATGMPFDLEPPANFLQILQRVWWRLDRALDEESIRSSALVGAAQAAMAGTTTVIDHHASPNAVDGSLDIVADALEEVGLRSILSYEVSDRDGLEVARAGLAENARFLAAERPLARGMVGAHASFTLSAETLAGCAALAEETGAGVHIHVAEDEVDQVASRAAFGISVIERLSRAEIVDERSLLAHCVHVGPREIATIRSTGATVAHNARSNMHNAVGRAPVDRLGERVAVGTDGMGGDLFAEAQAAYLTAHEQDRATGPDWALRSIAQGSAFTGRTFHEPLLGPIEPGAPADLTVVAYDPPTPLDERNLAGHYLFGLNAARVRDVMVAGETVVRDGQLTRLDSTKVFARAAEVAERLWHRMAQIPAHPFQPDGLPS
jgi:putative selenium metabolism protein SsnA